MPDKQEPVGRAAPDGTVEAGAVPSELSRLRSEAALHQRLRDLTLAFSRGVSSTLSLDTALQTLVLEANSLLGARRTSVWLYQRRAHELTLSSSSDPTLEAGAAVSTDDSEAPAVRGLRLDRPTLSADDRTLELLAPLRGWRRALGTLVVEGPFTDELHRDQLIELTRELSRQLSAAIENLQLLEEIMRQRRLLEDTFNSLVDLVVVTDHNLRIVQVNDAFIARVSLSRAELMEHPLEGLVGDEMAAWAAAPDITDPSSESADGGRTRQFEDARLGGTFSTTITPLITQGRDPTGYVLVARDITHQRRLEKEREALRERLGQSEKLASLGQFVAGIAHEMNNPLQGVLGHLELMIETSDAAKPIRRDLRAIYHEADRAAKIVRNLLAFTGSRRMSRRRLKLNRILSRVVASREAPLGKAGIEVVRHDATNLPPVSGDPLLLHQAFLNVVINAEHAIGSAGPSGRIEIRSWADASGSRILTTIRDTGPGIPAEALTRIFDPFFTTKEVGKGTGLGLAITYGIIQDHGGAIYAANAPDRGAIFTIELPAASDAHNY
jgi:PAS domain S-box-containing protein